MKKIILLAGLLITGFAQAQDLINVTTYGDAPIQEGQVFTYNILFSNANPHDGNLPIDVENISNETLNLKLRIDSMVNANGNEDYVSFCFHTSCYYSVTAGSIVPAAGTGLVLAPGESSTTNNHFANSWAGDTPGQPVIYNISIVRVDDNGTVIGDPLRSFTYKYAPTMGTSDFASLQKLGINVNNTEVNNQMTVTASQKANVAVYSATGQLVKSIAINEGTQSIDLSGLSAAVYVAKFTTENNQTSSIRIVKN